MPRIALSAAFRPIQQRLGWRGCGTQLRVKNGGRGGQRGKTRVHAHHRCP